MSSRNCERLDIGQVLIKEVRTDENGSAVVCP